MDMFARKVDISHVAHNDDLCDIDILMILSLMLPWLPYTHTIQIHLQLLTKSFNLLWEEFRGGAYNEFDFILFTVKWFCNFFLTRIDGDASKAVSIICNNKRPAVNLNEMKLRDTAFNKYPLCEYIMHRLILLISWVVFSILEDLVRIELIVML